MMKEIQGGITAAKGFLAAAAKANIKYKDRPDMALIYAETPAVTAAAYTTNTVKAAPVLWDKALTEGEGKVRAVVINSGIANACTGEEGMGVCAETAKEAAVRLHIQEKEVLVASTGVIGMPMPMERIKAGIALLAPALSNTSEAGLSAAGAILTTDTKEKVCAVEFEAGGKTVRLGGMAKGSGMIHPNMCTMLSFLTTDALISKALLQKALSETVADTYNMISVDGDMSTNDTVLLLANGVAGNTEITEEGEDYKAFCEALLRVNEALAKKIAADGEGATALFAAAVTDAASKEAAKTLARAVVSSNLVKTAIAGHDANWGRVFGALGSCGVPFNPEKVSLAFISKAGRVLVAENGKACVYSEEEAMQILSEEEVTAEIRMAEGTAQATAWGCDLTHGYIHINADYRS